MKRFVKIFGGLFALAFLTFTGCENFLNASEELMGSLKEEIEYQTADEVEVFIGYNSDEYGYVIGGISHYNTKVKVTYPFKVEFTPDTSAGNFAGWKAYIDYLPGGANVPLPDEEVHFDNPAKLNTSCTIKKSYGEKVVRIIPEVTPYPVATLQLPEDFRKVSPSPAEITPKKDMLVMKPDTDYTISVTTTADYGLRSENCWYVYTEDREGRRKSLDSNPHIQINVITAPYVSTAARDLGCSKSTVSISVDDQFTDSFFVEPVLTTYPSMHVQIPAEYSSLVKASHSDVIKMAQNTGYKISVTTDPTVGFAGWKFYKVDGDNTLDQKVMLLEAGSNTTTDIVTDSVLYDDAYASVYSATYEILETGRNAGKVTASIMLMLKQELTDFSLYLEPELFTHPVVNVVKPLGMDEAGIFSCSSGTLDTATETIRMLQGVDYSINFKTTDDYYFGEERFKVYTKNAEGLISPLSSIFNAQDLTFSVSDVITDSRQNPSMCSLSINLSKNYGSTLYVEPVLVKYPGVTIQLPEGYTTSQATLSPAGTQKFTLGADNTITLKTDPKVGFAGWGLYKLAEGKTFAEREQIFIPGSGTTTAISLDVVYSDDFIELKNPAYSIEESGKIAGKVTASLQVNLKKDMEGFSYYLIPELFDHSVVNLKTPALTNPGVYKVSDSIIDTSTGTVRMIREKDYSVSFTTDPAYCFGENQWKVYSRTKNAEGQWETTLLSSDEVSISYGNTLPTTDGQGQSVCTLTISLLKEFGETLYIEPVLVNVPSMMIGFDADAPSSGATLAVGTSGLSASEGTRRKTVMMAQGSIYEVSFNTDEVTGFNGWKLLRQDPPAAEGLAEPAPVVLHSAGSDTTTDLPVTGEVYRDEYVRIFAPEYTLITTGRSAGKTTAKIKVIVLKGFENCSYVLVPEIFRHPKVNVLTDPNAALTMSGTVTMLLNMEYEVSCTTNKDYGISGWEVYTDVDGVQTPIPASNDDIEIVQSEPVVSTARTTQGAATASIKVTLKKNFGTSLYVRPVVFAHSKVTVKLSDSENSTAAKLFVNGEQLAADSGLVKMITGTESQGFEYKLRCETSTDYAFKDWKFYTSDDGGVTKTDFDKASVNARGETVGTTMLNGQTTMFGEITVSLDSVVENLYVEPVLKQHPRVNVQIPAATPAGVNITAGALSVSPSGIIRKLAGEEYTVAAILQPGWIFRGWKLSKDTVEIFNGTDDFTTDEYLSLSASTLEEYTSGQNAGGSKATVQVTLKKELDGFSLFLEPVVEKRSTITFEKPEGFSTMNPASAVFNVAGMSYGLNCTTDKTSAFGGWKITRDGSVYPVYTAEIYEGLSPKPAADFCYETSSTSLSDIPEEVLNTANIIFMGSSVPVKQYDAQNQVTSTVSTTMYLNRYADYDLNISPERKTFTQVSFDNPATVNNYQSYPASSVYMETGTDYDITLTTKTGKKFKNEWTQNGAALPSGIIVQDGTPDWTSSTVKNALAVIYVPSEQTVHNEGHSTVNAKIRFMNGNGPAVLGLTPGVETLKRVYISDPALKATDIADADVVSSSGTLTPGTSAVIYAVNGNEFNYRFTTTSAYGLLGFAAGTSPNSLTMLTSDGADFSITESDSPVQANKLGFFNKVERKSYDNLKQCITEVTGTIHVYDDSENLYIRPIVKQYPAIEIAGSGTGVISPAGVRNQTQGMEFDIRYTAPVSHGFNGWSVTGSKNGDYTVTEDASALTSEKSIYVCDSLSVEEVPSEAKEKAILILLNHKVEETEDALGQVSQKVSAKVYVNKVVDEKLTVSASEIGYSQVIWDTQNLSSAPEAIYMKTGKEYNFRLVTVAGKKISSLTSSAATITSDPAVLNENVDGSFITTGTIKVTAAEGTPITVTPSFKTVNKIIVEEKALKGLSTKVYDSKIDDAGSFKSGLGSVYQIEGNSFSVKYETAVKCDFRGFSVSLSASNREYVKTANDNEYIALSNYSELPITDSLGQEHVQVTATFTIKKEADQDITINPVVSLRSTMSMGNVGEMGTVSPESSVSLALKKDSEYDISFVTSSGYGFSNWSESKRLMPVVALTPTEGYATYNPSIHNSNKQFILYLGAGNTLPTSSYTGCVGIIYKETYVQSVVNEGVETVSAKLRWIVAADLAIKITPVCYKHSYMYVSASNADVVPAEATKVMVHKGKDYDFQVVTKDGYKWDTSLTFAGGTVENLGSTVNPNFANYTSSDFVCYNVVPTVNTTTGAVTLTGKIRVMKESGTTLVISAGTKEYSTLSIGEINSNDTSRLTLKDEIGAGSVESRFITTYEKDGTGYKIGYTDYVIEAIAAEGKAVYKGLSMWKAYKEDGTTATTTNVLKTTALSLSNTNWNEKDVVIYGCSLEVNRDGICKAVAKVRVRDGASNYIIKPNVYTIPYISFKDPNIGGGTVRVDGKDLAAKYPVRVGETISFRYTIPAGFAISEIYMVKGMNSTRYTVKSDTTVSLAEGSEANISLDTNLTKAASFEKREISGVVKVNSENADGYIISPGIYDQDLSKPQISNLEFYYTPVIYSEKTETVNGKEYVNQENSRAVPSYMVEENKYSDAPHASRSPLSEEEYYNIVTGFDESTPFMFKIGVDRTTRPNISNNKPKKVIVKERLYYLHPNMIMNTNNDSSGKTVQLIGDEGFFMFDEIERGNFVPKHEVLYTYPVWDSYNNLISPVSIKTEDMKIYVIGDNSTESEFELGLDFQIPYGGVHQFEFVIEDKGGRRSAPRYIYMDYERDPFQGVTYGEKIDSVTSKKQIDGGITVKADWSDSNVVHPADNNKFSSMLLYGDGNDSVVLPLTPSSASYGIQGPVLKRNASGQKAYIRLINERGFASPEVTLLSNLSTGTASPGDIVVRKTGEDKLYYMSLLEYKENPSFGTPIAVVVTPNGDSDNAGTNKNRIIGMGLKVPPRTTSNSAVGNLPYCTKPSLITKTSNCGLADGYGNDNYDQIRSSYSSVTEANFPALFYCKNYDRDEMNGLMKRITYDPVGRTYKDWYLPSVKELKKLGENKDVLDEVLSSLNCQKASEYGYWASTTTETEEKAYVVTGTTETKMRADSAINAVRAFFDFTDYVEFYTK